MSEIQSERKKNSERDIFFGYSRIHVHVGIYPLLTSLFVNIYLFHVLKFFDYRIPRLPFEIVACTSPFLQNETNRPIGEHSLL